MDDLELCVAAAQAGAAVVADHFGRTTAAELKEKFNPVTAADHASETTIVDLIRSERPGDGILAEEGSGAATSGRRWIIDPLDGTVNFVHGIPHVGVSIALYEGINPLVGVIVDPIRDEEFVAVTGQGATLNGEPMAVSSTSELARAVVATGFPYDHDRRAARLGVTLAAVLEQVNGIRRMGAAALDFAWVAAGRYDGYWELDLAPWDAAAGIIMVTEAGGVVTDPRGAPSIPELPSAVAANNALAEDLRLIVVATLG